MLGPLQFLLYTSDLPIILEITPVGYADDSTLSAKYPSSEAEYQLYYLLIGILFILVTGASAGN